jgi:hypothetical protein
MPEKLVRQLLPGLTLKIKRILGVRCRSWCAND